MTPARVSIRLPLVLLAAAVATSSIGCAHQRAAASDATQLPERPPPGMVEIEVVSSDERTWDVYLGDAWEDRPVCTTPCMQWVDPKRPLFLYSRGDRKDRVAIPSLTHEMVDSGNGLLVATGRQRGKNTVGIVFTTLGGMGAVVGTTFTAVGCSNIERRGGACTAGLITLGASLPLTAISIWMMVDALPHVDLVPVYRPVAARGQPPVTVAFGPGSISGTF